MYVWGRGSVPVCAQGGYSFGEEAVSEPWSPGSDGPIAPARGHQVQQMNARVWAVLCDLLRSGEAAGDVYVLQGGEGAASDPLGGVNHSLEFLPVCLSALWKPHWDAERQNTLDGGALEGHQQLLSHVVLPEHPEEV